MSSAQQAEIDAAIKDAYQTLAGRYVLSCILTLIGYDYLLTLSDEVRLIWWQKFRLSTLSFIAIRYGAGGFVIFELVLHPGMQHCDEWMKFIFALQICARAGIVVVFIARTYAICHSNRIVLGILSLLGLFIMVLDCGQEGSLTCYSRLNSAVNTEIWAACSAISRVVFDVLVVTITLYRTIGIIKLPGRLKNLQETSTTSLILGNGLFYFCSVTLAESTVVIFFFLPSNKIEVKNIADPLPLPLACILVSRFLLGLRQQATLRNNSNSQTSTHQSTTMWSAGGGAHMR